MKVVKLRPKDFRPKDFLVLYLIGLFLVYAILVLDNFNWNLFEGKLAENFVWVFTTEFDNWQDLLTMLLFAYGVLGVNKVFWNLEDSVYQNLISIFEWPQNWLTILLGGLAFLLFYFKRKGIS